MEYGRFKRKSKMSSCLQRKTKLEEMARRYNIKIYLPKFHCELSPIEGVWAFEKNYARRKNKQSGLSNYLDLLNETKELIKKQAFTRSFPHGRY